MPISALMRARMARRSRQKAKGSAEKKGGNSPSLLAGWLAKGGK